MSNDTRASNHHVPALDGVRGLAILLVLIWHYASFVAPPGSRLAFALVPLRLTFTGVDLFFVLSGFLIGGILIDTRGRDRYFSSFYARRALRILPVYVAAVAFFYLLLLLRQNGVRGLTFATQGPLPFATYATFTQNLAMVTQGATVNGLSVTWSLAVEEQLYLVLPLVVALCAPQKLWIAGVAAIVIAIWTRMIWPDAAYLLSASRLDTIGLGLLAALLVRHPVWWPRLVRRPRILYLALAAGALGYTVVLLRVVDMVPLGFTVLAFCYVTLLLCALVSRTSIIARAFETRALRWLGKVSYTVYLVHMPAVFIAHGVLLDRDKDYPVIADVPSGLATLLALAATLGIAAASWRWFESPILALKRYVPAPRAR